VIKDLGLGDRDSSHREPHCHFPRLGTLAIRARGLVKQSSGPVARHIL
jgi:hypothetical protein